MDGEKEFASAFISYRGFKVFVVADKRDNPESWKYGDLIYLDFAGFPHNLPEEFVEKAKRYAFKLVDLVEVD